MSKVKSYKSFIIHLKRASGRKALVDDTFKKSPFEAEIIDAVDGSKLSQEEINQCYSEVPLYSLTYPFTLSVGEIGCFQSHRNIWKKIIDQDLTAALIFEDDVHIDEEAFKKAVSLATPHIEKLGYIQFQVREVLDFNTVIEKSKNIQIVQPTITPLRTSVQLVSREAAEKLLQMTQIFDRPVDTFLQMHWETDIHLACAVPSGVSDRTQESGGSTLSLKKRSLIKKLGRAFKRHKYRNHMRNYSRNNINNTS